MPKVPKIITVESRRVKILDIPGVLVHSHGPFTWAKGPAKAVHYAVVLEQVARMAYHSLQLNPNMVFNRDLLKNMGLEHIMGRRKKSKSNEKVKNIPIISFSYMFYRGGFIFSKE
jgi:L-ribulose-5-phosphate 4-epimerase